MRIFRGAMEMPGKEPFLGAHVQCSTEEDWVCRPEYIFSRPMGFLDLMI
jgi:hypothetical protein